MVLLTISVRMNGTCFFGNKLVSLMVYMNPNLYQFKQTSTIFNTFFRQFIYYIE